MGTYRANGGNNTNSLVTRNQGELGDEFTLMDVLAGIHLSVILRSPFSCSWSKGRGIRLQDLSTETRVSSYHSHAGRTRIECFLDIPVPQTPQARTLTRTSLSRISGRGTSTIDQSSGFS